MTLVRNYIYRTIRYSGLYPVYLKFFRSSVYSHYQKEYLFYAKLLKGKDGFVYDIGANVGDKSAIFKRLGKKVLTVEPDSKNFLLLKKRFQNQSKVELMEAAIGAVEGKEAFYVDFQGSPANTLSKKWKSILEDPGKNRWSKKLELNNSYEVAVLTLENLIKIYGMPQFIKVDVEGYEHNVIRGLRSEVEILSIEANLPEFRNETIQCVQDLNKISPSYTFNCINERFEFFWDQNKNANETTKWLQQTDLRYFEVFCFLNQDL